MPSQMPPIPPANRSKKGGKSVRVASKDEKLVKHERHANSAEEGDTANIKQNTTAFFVVVVSVDDRQIKTRQA